MKPVLPVVRCAAVVLATLVPLSALPTAHASPAPAAPAAPATAAVVAESYDLGVSTFPQPGDVADMPIRLWGAIAVPEGDGPFPVVVITHGRHGDNCPEGEFDASTWPCWDIERRSDLGFDYLARELAERGVLAISPDVNAAYTEALGEGPRLEKRRYSQVLNATMRALRSANAGSTDFDGLDLTGLVDLDRVGVLGHSRGGFNAVRWTRSKDYVQSLFLLAPFYGRTRMPDIPTTVTIGRCDGDVGTEPERFTEQVGKDRDRSARLWELTVARSNHNFYNATLVTERSDEGKGGAGCRKAQRATPRQQQRWLVKVAWNHFAATLLEPPTVARYLRREGTRQIKVARLGTQVQAYVP